MPRTSSFLTIVVLGISLAVAACREEGDIKIASLKLVGVKSVDEGQLTNALQTKRGSRLPWGRKRFFDRRAFDADLKRIQAFYRDRGFPDARVASFDVKLNDTQDQVDIAVRIVEGDPERVAAIDIEGVDVLPESARKRLHATLPLQPEQPLDRQQALAVRERVTNMLRDRGYAYAEVQPFRRWAGGVRYDWTEYPLEPGHEWAVQPYLTFIPSDFLKFRIGYKHTRRDRPLLTDTGLGPRTMDEVFLQGTFILGAHPAHPF